jgi:transposase
MREIVNALFYQNRTGCQWQLLPHDLPPWSAVSYYFRLWRDDGTDQAIHDMLQCQAREKAGRTEDLSAVAMDTQSVRADAPRTPPSPRRLVSWLTSRPDNLPKHHRTHLDDLLATCPHLSLLADRIREFARLLTERRGQDLDAWMAGVDADDLPALHGFVHGLRMDLPAVTAGLTLPYSNGPIEGANNKIKMLKRQMYGRAGFALLRQRILLA